MTRNRISKQRLKIKTSKGKNNMGILFNFGDDYEQEEGHWCVPGIPCIDCPYKKKPSLLKRAHNFILKIIKEFRD